MDKRLEEKERSQLRSGIVGRGQQQGPPKGEYDSKDGSFRIGSGGERQDAQGMIGKLGARH